MNRESRPLVSVVLTTYERGVLFRRAFESVLRQTYKPLQIIVVEDGSESGVREWMEEAGHLEAVQYVRHDTNRGLAAARNTGLERAEGQFVAFLDDDDEWFPGKIAAQVDALVHSADGEKVVGVYCGLAYEDSFGTTDRKPIPNGSCRAALKRYGLSAIPDNSGLFSIDLLRDLGGLDETLRSHTEYGFWMRLAERDYHVTSLDYVLMRVHQHGDHQMTKDYAPRIAASERFLSYWEPRWVEWYGRHVSSRLKRAFVITAFAGTAENLLVSGRLGDGLRCCRLALAESRFDLKVFGAILAVLVRVVLRKTGLYARLRQVWRGVRGAT
ncbi:MAG: glycosyltransferase [Verrucomicrobia bacterium]|nr:glycosyltransferase [Verrucomicrobiota bacterium]